MKTAKILLWDEIEHDEVFPWPTPKALPQEYNTFDLHFSESLKGPVANLGAFIDALRLFSLLS